MLKQDQHKDQSQKSKTEKKVDLSSWGSCL